jgi:hypothetical protein
MQIHGLHTGGVAVGGFDTAVVDEGGFRGCIQTIL